jgi:hypothetical protein
MRIKADLYSGRLFGYWEPKARPLDATGHQPSPHRQSGLPEPQFDRGSAARRIASSGLSVQVGSLVRVKKQHGTATRADSTRG